MADNIDLQYVAALQDFNKSVAILISAIQEQVKNEQGSLKTTVASMADQFKSMAESAEKLDVIVQTSEKTEKNTSEILKIVQQLKKEKKKGLFDKLAPQDKTRSMAEGIKTIALMGGALLAIGGAFKLIGDVDFATVASLTLALPVLAYTFQKINEAGIDPETAVSIGRSTVIMAGALAASGFILSLMPTLSIPQMISVIGVAASMGIAMYALLMVSDNLNIKEVGQMFLLAAVMPVVAAGMVLSGMLLQNLPQIDLMSTIQSSLAIAGSTAAMALAAGLVSKIANPISILLGTLSLTIAAGGLALSSQLIAMGDYSNYPSIDWAKGFGQSMLAAVPAVIVLGTIAMTGIGAIAILAGIASMIAVAGGLAIASKVIKTGDYTGGPTPEWAMATGIAITSFANALDTLEPGLIDMLSGDSLDQRIAMIVKVAAALKLSSFLIKGGDYTGGPSKEWSEGVGIAIMAFANAMDALEPGVLEMLTGESLTSRINLMVELAKKLPMLANEINKGGGVYDVTKAPSKAWSEGVGGALMAFATAMGELEPGVLTALGGDSLQQRIMMLPLLAAQLPFLATILQSGGVTYNEKLVPSKAWSEGAGGALVAFATAIGTLANEIDIADLSSWTMAMMPIAPLMAYFGVMLSKGKYDKYPSKEWAEGIGAFYQVFSEMDIAKGPKELAIETIILSQAYIKLAASLMVLGNSMKGLGQLPDISGLYGGLVTLSLIDEANLNKTLDTLNTKQAQFQKVFETIKAVSSSQIDSSTFAFNKDKSSAPKSDTTTPLKGTAAQASVTAQAAPKKDQKTIEADKSNELMKRMIQLLEQMNAGIDDVATNTSKSLHSDPDMINK